MKSVRRPRIIFVNRYFHPDESATSRLLSQLAFELARDYPVEVIASRQLIEAPDACLSARESVQGVKIRRVWSTRYGRYGLSGRAADYASFCLSVFLLLLVKLRRGDILVAKTDPPLLGVIAMCAALGRGVRVVNWLQDLYPEIAWRLGVIRESARASRIIRRLRDVSLRRAAANVAISEGMQRYISTRIADVRCICIHNWAELGLSTDTEAMRRDLGLEANVVLGYAGNLGRAHALDALRALAAAPLPLPELRCLFVGSGVHMQELRTEVAAAGQGGWQFLPYQDRERLPALLSAIDIHLVVLDPRVESLIFPSKLFGILAAGRPVLHLGGHDSELARLLARHDCGITVAADDGAGLRAALVDLVRNPQWRHEAGLRARAAFEAEYTIGHAVAKWRQLLEAITKKPGRTLA